MLLHVPTKQRWLNFRKQLVKNNPSFTFNTYISHTKAINLLKVFYKLFFFFILFCMSSASTSSYNNTCFVSTSPFCVICIEPANSLPWIDFDAVEQHLSTSRDPQRLQSIGVHTHCLKQQQKRIELRLCNDEGDALPKENSGSNYINHSCNTSNKNTTSTSTSTSSRSSSSSNINSFTKKGINTKTSFPIQQGLYKDSPPFFKSIRECL